MKKTWIKTNREILNLAIPSIVSNITVPLLGLVDLTIVGHIGNENHIGAIAIGSMIFNIMYWILGFLRMGTSGMTSQAYGRESWDDALSCVVACLNNRCRYGFDFHYLPICNRVGHAFVL